MKTVVADEEESKPVRKRKSRAWILLFFPIAFYFCCGIFVMPPRDSFSGATVIYRRGPGGSLPFLSSPESMASFLEKDEGEHHPTRMEHSLSALASSIVVSKLKLITLPYSETLYSWATPKHFEDDEH